MSRIRDLGGIAQSCPYCLPKRRNKKVKVICSHCESTGLVSLITYERYFAEKYDRPIDLNKCRIPPMIKENNQLSDDEYYCPF